MSGFLYVLAFAALLYGSICGYMFLAQRKLLYLPSETPAYPKEQEIHGVTFLRVRTEDNQTLVAWYKASHPGFPTVLYFHGNAGNLADRTDKFRALTDQGFGVFAVNYRGYGGSTGHPTEQGLYTDARAALARVQALGVPLTSLIFYGESLGTGVAIQLASETAPLMLVLEAPYTSVADRAAQIYPYLPVRFLLRDRFDSLSKMEKISCPLLLFHGENDLTIPVHMGRTLLEKATGTKAGHFYPNTGHVDFDIGLLASTLRSFAYTQKFIPQ